MSPKELVEEHKIYLEDLERWVVPLEVVEQALSLKSSQEMDKSLNTLQDNLSELNKLFQDLGKNLNG